jgi:hypothetical protein
MARAGFFLFLLRIAVDAAEFAGELLLEFRDLLEFPRGLRLGDLVLQEDFALGDLGAAGGLDIGDLGLCAAVSFWVGDCFSSRSMASS